jgi:hypothetical protein
MDLARFLRIRRAIGSPDVGALAFEGFYSFLLPQFEGIEQAEGEQLYSQVRGLVGARRAERLRRTLNAVLGLQLVAGMGGDEMNGEPEREPVVPRAVGPGAPDVPCCPSPGDASGPARDSGPIARGSWRSSLIPRPKRTRTGNCQSLGIVLPTSVTRQTANSCEIEGLRPATGWYGSCINRRRLNRPGPAAVNRRPGPNHLNPLG